MSKGRRCVGEDPTHAADADTFTFGTDRDDRERLENVAAYLFDLTSHLLNEFNRFDGSEEDHSHKSDTETIDHQPGKSVHAFASRQFCEFQGSQSSDTHGIIAGIYRRYRLDIEGVIDGFFGCR